MCSNEPLPLKTIPPTGTNRNQTPASIYATSPFDCVVTVEDVKIGGLGNGDDDRGCWAHEGGQSFENRKTFICKLLPRTQQNRVLVSGTMYLVNLPILPQ